MKFIRRFSLVLIILVLIVSCNTQEQVKPQETLGNINEITDLLPTVGTTWTYKGTGVYYHEMILEDIISSDHFVYYKIIGEILSDEKNSNYSDYLTEIRYIVSRKGWQQELQQSKLLDSKYKGMYLLKFPIEEDNTWEEKVLDFNDNRKTITGKIESIDVIEGQRIINVRHSEKNSDYYELRKIKEGIGVIEFEKYIKINEEDHILRYSLDDFYSNDGSTRFEIRTFLTAYNEAWENYYNNQEPEIFDFIVNNSSLVSNISSFKKTDNTRIDFLGLVVKSVLKDENQYHVEVDESFSVLRGEEEYIQSNEKKYILIEENEGYKILKVE